jgi:hypothetical protein
LLYAALIDWCLVSGIETVPPIRELTCLVSGNRAPFSAVTPPHQKLPSSDAQSRCLLKS